MKRRRQTRRRQPRTLYAAARQPPLPGSLQRLRGVVVCPPSAWALGIRHCLTSHPGTSIFALRKSNNRHQTAEIDTWRQTTGNSACHSFRVKGDISSVWYHALVHTHPIAAVRCLTPSNTTHMLLHGALLNMAPALAIDKRREERDSLCSAARCSGKIRFTTSPRSEDGTSGRRGSSDNDGATGPSSTPRSSFGLRTICKRRDNLKPGAEFPDTRNPTPAGSSFHELEPEGRRAPRITGRAGGNMPRTP